jgi:hypothetical protein
MVLSFMAFAFWPTSKKALTLTWRFGDYLDGIPVGHCGWRLVSMNRRRTLERNIEREVTMYWQCKAAGPPVRVKGADRKEETVQYLRDRTNAISKLTQSLKLMGKEDLS